MSNSVYNQFNEKVGEAQGNVRIYVSDTRLIYRLYNFDIVTDRVTTPRSEKVNVTDQSHRRINLQNKKIDLLGYGLCNDWQYFFTGTVDPKAFTDAADFDKVSKMISNVFRELRRKHKNVAYCFILEKHQNGNFHAHGFCNLPDEYINPYCVYVQQDGFKVHPGPSKYLQWMIKQCYYKYGLNVISPINNKNDVADYCAKYIIKDIATGDSFSKSIFKSHGLKSFEIKYGHYGGDKFECFPGIVQDTYPISNVMEVPFHSVGSNVWEMSIDLV